MCDTRDDEEWGGKIFIPVGCCSVDLGNAPVLHPTTVQFLAIAAEPYSEGFAIQVFVKP
jgi:hypothetical protein